MEFAGILVAVIACMIVVYALPAAIARRKAVVSSREGDRFSPGVELVEFESGSAARKQDSLSTRPLLSTSHAASSEGTHMSHLEASGADSGASAPRTSKARPVSPTQQMAALRARRVARLAREQAAVQRRIVAAGLAVVLTLVFTIVAAFGAMAWAWLAVPGVLLVGTVISSALGAYRAQQQNAAEMVELEEIKVAIAEQRERGDARRREAAAKRGTLKLMEAVKDTPKKPHRELVEVVEDVVAHVEVAAETAVETTAESAPETTVKVVTVREEAVREEVVVETRAASPKAEERRTWDAIQLPPARGSRPAPVINRRVHADTDLVPVLERRTKGVPARPLRKSDQVAAASATAAALTGPTFRFDLDAVLEQRRAQ
ncbi:hypothetical protein [Actinomyces minihominis]|uniref:hypothetical protein n=1 Tax=Actinomyces minihominis TaxID=2002838 RepID=UPI000C08BFE5|nr:hypothetical protein [Actinomyces minihominis]